MRYHNIHKLYTKEGDTLSDINSDIEDKVASMIKLAMAEQCQFMDSQHWKTHLTKCADISTCTKDVSKLRADTSILHELMNTTEKTSNDNRCKITELEAKLADLEDWSRPNNIQIQGISKGVEGSNACQ